MKTLEQLLREAQALPVEDRLRLIAALCEGLRRQLHKPRPVALEGLWADLPFDDSEEGIDRALEALHRQSWHHLEEEGRDRPRRGRGRGRG